MDNYGSLQVETDTKDLSLLRDHDSTNSESSAGKTSTGKPRGIRSSLLVVMGLWLVVMAVELSPFVFMVSTRQYQTFDSTDVVDDDDNNNSYDNDDDALHALWASTASLGIYNVRHCSVEQCLLSPCQNAKSAPFACLALKQNEYIRGGCGSTPWTRGICSEQCNASECDRLLKHAEKLSSRNSLETKDCDVECPKHWCRRNRLCGDEDASYQCTAGLSMYGCSSDKFEWTLRSTETDCSSCCKTTSCDV